MPDNPHPQWKRYRLGTILVIIWILCGILTSGGFTASFQFEFPDQSVRSDMAASMFPCLVGPLGLFATLITTGFFEHGMCWTEESCVPIKTAGRHLRDHRGPR